MFIHDAYVEMFLCQSCNVGHSLEVWRGGWHGFKLQVFEGGDTLLPTAHWLVGQDPHPDRTHWRKDQPLLCEEDRKLAGVVENLWTSAFHSLRSRQALRLSVAFGRKRGCVFIGFAAPQLVTCTSLLHARTAYPCGLPPVGVLWWLVSRVVCTGSKDFV